MINSSARRNPRWWPAVAVVAAAASGIAAVWLSGGERTTQERLFLTVPIVLAGTILLAVWLLFFSRLSRGARLRVVVAALALLALAAGTLRVGGVTGDLVPILEWRWAARPQALDPLPAPIEAAGSSLSTPAPAASSAVGEPANAGAPTTAPDPRDAALGTTPDPHEPGGSYPQFLGPDRDGRVTGVHLAWDWAVAPPREIWRRNVGAGWSGFAVSGGLAITQEQRGEQEMVVAYRAKDGSPVWAHGDRARYQTTMAGEGPRATPTISGDRVFTLGSTGLLNALDLQSGRSLWRRDVAADNDSPLPDWGRSSSPLVVDDMVVVSVGGTNGRSLVAYRRESGEIAWHAGDDLASYSSPQLATLAGVRQILILNQDSIASHDPASGRVLWQHAWPRMQPSVAQPLLLGDDRVLFSVGYGIGSRLLRVAQGDGGALKADLVWESLRLKAKFANLVVHQGFVYGLDDGVMVSLDPGDGERKWKSGRYGHGQVILANDILLVQTEEGELVLVEPTPDAHKELSRFAVFSRKTWNPPALAGRMLFVRNDAEAVCFELPVAR
jgi:outer membrane protein assembly factor BamB